MLKHHLQPACKSAIAECVSVVHLDPSVTSREGQKNRSWLWISSVQTPFPLLALQDPACTLGFMLQAPRPFPSLWGYQGSSAGTGEWWYRAESSSLNLGVHIRDL